jgi:hypothetical protein
VVAQAQIVVDVALGKAFTQIVVDVALGKAFTQIVVDVALGKAFTQIVVDVALGKALEHSAEPRACRFVSFVTCILVQRNVIKIILIALLLISSQ